MSALLTQQINEAPEPLRSYLHEVAQGWNADKQRELVLLRDEVAMLRAKVESSQSEMAKVWHYLQRVSGWSESNDMSWSDEIICGIDILRQDGPSSDARE